MKLAQLQRAFQQHVLHGDNAVLDALSGHDAEDVRTRLSIYSNAYVSRLHDALAVTFPFLQRAVGATHFAELVSAFARSEPSRFASVRDYGAQLPHYIATHLDGVAATCVRELGVWEWKLAAVFDAPDTHIDLSLLGQTLPEQWENLTFAFTPALQRHVFTTNAMSWYENGDDTPLIWEALSVPASYVAWRREYRVHYRALSPGEAAALDAAMTGASFGVICELLVQEDSRAGLEQAAVAAAQYLRTWIDDELLMTVTLRD